MSDTLSQHIVRAGRTLDVYNRVCAELDDGKDWADIDKAEFSVGSSARLPWTAYMRQRILNHLRTIVLTHRQSLAELEWIAGELVLALEHERSKSPKPTVSGGTTLVRARQALGIEDEDTGD